jgi:YfiR/HmsC-like
MRRPRLRLLVVLMLLGPPLMLFAERTPREKAENSREYAVKVTVLFKLALFVEWPERGHRGSAEPFVIGVLGEDPFGPLLEQVTAGEEIDGRPFFIIRSDRIEPLLSSQILFISRSEDRRLDEVLASSKDHHLLTVSEIPGFCERGGMVNLLLDGGKVRIELNRQEAEGAELRINSKLVKLAREVATGKASREQKTSGGGDRSRGVSP